MYDTGSERNFIRPHLSLMADNILLSFEGLCAGVADKEPLIAVDMLFMDLQVAAVSEGLQAGVTAIDDICFHSMVRTGQESSNGLQQHQKTNVLSLDIISFCTFWKQYDQTIKRLGVL